jgi:septal ring factor EnvC (AmiA/AmiB activator)
MSILFLAIWQTFESESNNTSMTLVDERLSLIEEQINVVDETNNDSMTDITSSIQFLDKEIRKLWDLSNKRNKVNIQNLTKQMQVVENLISDLQSNLDKNEKDINQIKKNINLNLAKLNSLELTEENIESIQLSIKNVDMQLILLEDSVQALNSYKNQLNQVILEIQTDISIIQSSSIQNSPNQN